MAPDTKQRYVRPRRTLSNTTEEKFAQLAEKNGWRVTKRGWPDFLCFGPDDEVIAVEVKPRISDKSRGYMKLLRADQVTAMDVLKAAGVRCYVSDGDKLEPYNPSLHGPRSRRRWKPARYRNKEAAFAD